MKRDPAFERLLVQIRSFLPEYLEENNVEFNKQGKVCCLSPEHDDKTPSMGFLKRQGVVPETFLKCFGCGVVYDVFHLAHVYEQKPLEGKGFLFDNVYYLADKWGIPHEKQELTERELAELRQERLYNTAAEVLRDLIEAHEEFQDYARNRRGLSREICLAQGVGTVPWQLFLSTMEERGFNKEFIHASGINKDKIGGDRMTLTLRDMRGKVVGFDRRYIDFDTATSRHYSAAGEYYPPKYQATSQDKCFLIQKELLLYGIHIAKKHSMKRLDIFESYLDWLTAIEAGHPCCAALCGSALTDMQVEVIRECGFTEVNLVLNGDETGMRSMVKYLEKFRNKTGLKVTCMFLGFHETVPMSDRDVDYYLRAFDTGDLREGLRNYFAHEPISAFDHQLSQYMAEDGMTRTRVVQEMVGFILNEESPLVRGELCKKLATVTEVPEEDIRAEIAAIEDSSIEEISEKLNRQLFRAPDSRAKADLMRAAVEELDHKIHVRDEIIKPAESIEFIRESYEEFAHPQDKNHGWMTGLSNWDDSLGGISKSKEVYVLLGGPNVGKSALLTNLEAGLLQNSDEPCVLVLSLDDPRRTALAKIHSVISGFAIQDVTFPRERVFKDEGLKKLWEEGRDQIMEYADSGRLVIAGSSGGNSTDAFERLIKATQDQTGRPVVVFGDSFHNVGGEGEERVKFKKAFQWIQDTTDWLDYTAVWTVEMTKQGFQGKGRFFHAAETGKIAYGAKLVGVLYNEMHDKRELAETYWMDEPTQEGMSAFKRPIVQVEIEKNKLLKAGSFKGTLYFKFRDYTGQFFSTTRQEIKDELKRNGALEENEVAAVTSGIARQQSTDVPF